MGSSGRRPTAQCAITRLGELSSDTDRVIVEEPLEIRVAGEPLAVTMRTPGQDLDLALGWLLSEGIIAGIEDVGSLTHCGRPGEEGYGNVVEVSPGPGCHLAAEPFSAARRPGTTNSACGVCGRRTLEDLLRLCYPLDDSRRLQPGLVEQAISALQQAQTSFRLTGGSHGAAVVDAQGQLIASAEDVGRHNAVDKVVGQLLRRAAAPDPAQPPAVLAVSGRVSFEIVHKAAVARLPVVAGISAPTSLSVRIADHMGITLAGFVRPGAGNVYSHAERLGLCSGPQAE